MTTARKAIVVGTGAGGLTAAAYLAKDGFEVVALDQADRIGGFLAPFTVDGYAFDPGVHYVGGAGRGQLMDRVLGDLGIDVERAFVELDPDGFDAYRFPDLEVRMCRGLERYRDRLIECFPQERTGLHRLFDFVARYHDAARVWPIGRRLPRIGLSRRADLGAWRHLPSVLRWVRSSFADLLGHLLHEPKARAVIAAPDGDVGLPPSRLAALAGIGVLDHYLDGAYYPRGGSGALRDALVACATKHGARFRTGADVTEILVRGSSVTGVKLASGEQLEAEVVVSDVDPTITFGKLLARAVVPGRLRRKVERTKHSLSAFTIFLGLRRDLRARGLGAFNVWQYPTWDLEACYAPCLEGRIPDQLALFISSSTSRDDSGRLAPAGCSTLQIVGFMPWQPFARWADVPPEQRGADFHQLRREIADRMLGEVDRHWPGLVGDVAVERIATPLSNTDYVRAVEGGIYGPAHTADQMGPWRFAARTPIHGLVLAGAGVYSCGVASCLASGQSAAAIAVGRVRAPRAVRARAEELAPTPP